MNKTIMFCAMMVAVCVIALQDAFLGFGALVLGLIVFGGLALM